MILRIRHKEGICRVQIEPNDNFYSLAQKIAPMLNIADPEAISFGKQESDTTPVHSIKQKTLSSADLKHGDIIFAAYSTEDVKQPLIEKPELLPVSKKAVAADTKKVSQDAVDDFLENQRGLIDRPRDAKFCRHGDNAKCSYCMPLEPFDQNYLEHNKIKHMSFHSYLRQLDAEKISKDSWSSGRNELPLLDEPNFKVKAPCTGGHPPWPDSICTKCQPGAIKLRRQPYRLVDHVEFSSKSQIDNFLLYWRKSGCQRFGYLYGRYEPYLDVPLGIKAVVEAIYEPPQHNYTDGLELVLPWAEEDMVNEVAKSCGLVPVGMIFTDLTDDGSGQGTVVVKRHKDSYFLTSLECAFAAEMQRLYPSATKRSSSGKYGSKFVACVVSGNTKGEVEINAYQVSDTMTAMQEAGIVEPSRNPSLLRVKKSIPRKRFVPEVMYEFKNEYGVTTRETANPTFPVDFMLVNVTHGFPNNPSPLFRSTEDFAIENRISIGNDQSLTTLNTHLSGAHSDEQLRQQLADFHLLCYIRSLYILGEHDFQTLCDIVSGKNSSGQPLNDMEGWKTFMLVVQEAGHALPSTSATLGSSTAVPGASSSAMSAEIPCRHCTFKNPGGAVNCEICGLPLDQ